MSTTKPFLLFAIPTWNRVRELEVCLRSIAQQTTHQIRTIKIYVQDDCSTDGTKESVEALQREYPDLITYTCTNQRVDYSNAFRTLFSSVDADWVWTFGDDDMLLPGSLDRMIPVLAETDCEFIHCVERGREAGTDRMYRGKLLALCNTFGWLDMTGFITCNITRGYALNEAAESPRWKQYAKSSFVQSCVLLEILKDSQAALMDVPLVATQNANQTQECIDRWAADKIGPRYNFMADCIDLMMDDGVLTGKVRPVFFRYQNYHLWDRHMTYYTHDYLSSGVFNTPDSWAAQTKLCRFVDDEAFSGEVVNDIETVRGLIHLHGYLSMQASELRTQIEELKAKHEESPYPWAYVVPRQLR